VSEPTELHIDLGNSRGKWRLLHDCQAVSQGTVEPETGRGLPRLDALEASLITGNARFTYPIHVTLASVADAAIEAHLRSSLRDQMDCVIETLYTPVQAMGMTNSYADHTRMGIDRWLAMLAAWYPNQTDVVVVDAGSALTLDVVAANGQHQGGLIIPGANLSERVLLEKTGKVRFQDNVEHELLLGKSTAECVRYGIAHSQLGALESVAKRFQLEGHQWFFAGGAGEWLMQRMDVAGRLAPDLVLDGIGLVGASKM
jgi:type III pantothenate kinase